MWVKVKELKVLMCSLRGLVNLEAKPSEVLGQVHGWRGWLALSWFGLASHSHVLTLTYSDEGTESVEASHATIPYNSQAMNTINTIYMPV